MKLFKSIIIIMALTCIPIDAKKPPKLPKEPKTPLSSEQKQAIVAGAAQVLSSVLTIVQNPHDKHNVGNSVANILHGFINILVEKIGNRKIDLNDISTIEECIEQICQEFSEHIAGIVTTKKS